MKRSKGITAHILKGGGSFCRARRRRANYLRRSGQKHGIVLSDGSTVAPAILPVFALADTVLQCCSCTEPALIGSAAGQSIAADLAVSSAQRRS